MFKFVYRKVVFDQDSNEKIFNGIVLKSIEIETNEYEPEVKVHFEYQDESADIPILVTELSLPDFITVKLIIIDDKPRFEISLANSDIGEIITDAFYWCHDSMLFQVNDLEGCSKWIEVMDHTGQLEHLGNSFLAVIQKLNEDIVQKAAMAVCEYEKAHHGLH